MEAEFKRTGLPQGGPSYSDLVIDALRKGRQEHPIMDMAAGSLPIVGGMQAGMDVTDSSLGGLDRTLAMLSIVPGGKLVGAGLRKIPYVRKIPAKAEAIINKLRRDVPDEPPYTPEEIFQKPDVVMTSEQREAAREAANKAYAEQLLREEQVMGPTKKDIIRAAKKAGHELYDSHHSGLILEKEYKELPYDDFVKQFGDAGPFFDEYDYAFHPSTGKGFDVASSPLSTKYADKDGALYIGGGSGVFKITDLPSEKELKKRMIEHLRSEGNSDFDISEQLKPYGWDDLK